MKHTKNMNSKPAYERLTYFQFVACVHLVDLHEIKLNGHSLSNITFSKKRSHFLQLPDNTELVFPIIILNSLKIHQHFSKLIDRASIIDTVKKHYRNLIRSFNVTLGFKQFQVLVYKQLLSGLSQTYLLIRCSIQTIYSLDFLP